MIVFYRLEGRDYKEIGRVEDGEIVAGEPELDNIVYRPNLSDEDELLNAHDGPHILAQMEDESDDGESPPGSPDRDTEKWLPYSDGGERGWISANTGEKRFTEQAPGPIVKGFEGQAEDWTERETLNKEWIPYQGPHGGEGWQEVETGKVRYTEEPPGQTRTGDETPPENGMTPEERAWLEEHGADEEALAEVREEAPDGTTETSEEITWENVAAGDKIAYYNDRGELEQGTVTAVEQDAFGVVWVQDGNRKVSVEEEDFIGTPEDKIGDGIEAPDNVSAEWMDENLFYGQTVKLYNHQTDMVEYADVHSIFVAGGEINAVELEIQNDRGIGGIVTITNDGIDWGRDDDNDQYEIRETSSWDSLDTEEQQDALKRSFRENTNMRNISRQTRKEVNRQVNDEIIPAFSDPNVGRETIKSLFKITNKVSRASCRGTGSVSIKVSERAKIGTTRHEFGHAIMGAFGYNYQNNYRASEHSDEKYKRRPTNLSRDYNELKTRYDTIAFDFSQGSDFFAPEDYMLRDKYGDSESNAPPGYSEWKEAVEEEVYSDTELEQREYENAENMSPKEVFESVDKGDVVRFQHEDKTIHLIAQEKEDLAQEDRRDYEFVQPDDGSQWHFTTSGDELQFSRYIVTGYDDTYSDEEEASPSVDDPLENFEGFEPNAETTEDRMDNLVSAVNRAWYKQAKHFENDPSDFDNSAYSIGSGYSATNAHETMAKTHEVMLNGDQLAVSHLIEEHPYLVAAYLDVFEPHMYAKKAIHRHGGEEYGIEV